MPANTSDAPPRSITAVCEACDWSFLVPADETMPVCPHCQQAVLTAVDHAAAGAQAETELAAPFSVADVDLGRGLQRFASGFLFRPPDLTAGNLRSRLQRVYLPRWLVDCDVQAEWRADAGFNYQVVSHEDEFSDTSKAWQSREVRETRVRWEPRVGRLTRRYENVVAPAMEEDDALRKRLGDFDLTFTTPVNGRLPDAALIRTANRTPDDAWADAVPAIRQRAVAECRNACQANHLREFDWSPQFADQHWTQLLLPVYASHYRDERNIAHAVLIHGQTGKAYGRRQASLRPARNLSLALGALAVLALVASLLMVLLSSLDGAELLRGLGLMGVLAAMSLGILAVFPVAYVWIFNRMQPPDPPL